MRKYKYLIIFLFSAPIFFGFCIFLADFFLKNITNHNQLIEVPNLVGKTTPRAINELTDLKLNYERLNIGAYNPNFKTGSVVSQDPLPNDKVKEGRKIYLTINLDKIPNTAFPDISDEPFRYAIALLKSYKLKVGSIFYRNDIAENVVLKSTYQGVLIKKSDSLPIFSSVDLYIGSGEPKNQFEFKVPQLNGLFLHDAENMLKENFLNVGEMYFDKTLSDSLNLFVYKQSMQSSETTQIFKFNSQSKAPSVDLWLTNDTSKLIN